MFPEFSQKASYPRLKRFGNHHQERWKTKIGLWNCDLTIFLGVRILILAKVNKNCEIVQYFQNFLKRRHILV